MGLLKSIIKGVGGAIPIAGPVISAGLDYLQNRNANNAVKDQRAIDNAYIAKNDANNAAVLARLQAAGFDPYGPQVSTSQSSGTQGSTTNTRSVQDVNQLTGTEIMGPYQGMEGKLRSLVEGRLGKGSPVTDGEIATQLKNINRSNAAAEAAVKNVIGSRGLGKAQAGAALTPMQIARTSQITDFLGTIPETERQRNMQNEQQAQGLISAFGTGQRTTGRTTTNTNQSMSGFSNMSGSQTGGPDINTILRLTAPTAGQQSMNTGYSPGLAAGADLTSALTQMYANNKKTPGSVGMPTNLFTPYQREDGTYR